MLLFLRKKTYYLRLRVPVDLIYLFGRQEIKLSLKTGNKSEAKKLMRLKAGESERAFCNLRAGKLSMTDGQLKRLADRLLSEILNTVETARQRGTELWELSPDEWPDGYVGQVPMGLHVLDATLTRDKTENKLNHAEQSLKARIVDLRAELRLGKYSEQTRQLARRRAVADGIPVPPDSWFIPPGLEIELGDSTWNDRYPDFEAICRAVVQTLIDVYEIETERLNGTYGTDKQVRAETCLTAAAKRYTLAELWASYRDRKMTEGKWTETTLEKYSGFVNALSRTLGPDYDYSTFEDTNAVTDLIKKLKEYKSTRTGKKWSDTSVNDCLIFLSTLHKYAIQNRLFEITYNPFVARQIIETDGVMRNPFFLDRQSGFDWTEIPVSTGQ